MALGKYLIAASLLAVAGSASATTIIFVGGTNGVGFQYWVIGGNRGVYEAIDAANVSLGQLIVDASNGDVLGTHSFNGLVDRLTFSGNAGFVQVSGVTFEGRAVPEPSIYALMALGLAGAGVLAAVPAPARRGEARRGG